MIACTIEVNSSGIAAAEGCGTFLDRGHANRISSGHRGIVHRCHGNGDGGGFSHRAAGDGVGEGVGAVPVGGGGVGDGTIGVEGNRAVGPLGDRGEGAAHILEVVGAGAIGAGDQVGGNGAVLIHREAIGNDVGDSRDRLADGECGGAETGGAAPGGCIDKITAGHRGRGFDGRESQR